MGSMNSSVWLLKCTLEVIIFNTKKDTEHLHPIIEQMAFSVTFSVSRCLTCYMTFSYGWDNLLRCYYTNREEKQK